MKRLKQHLRDVHEVVAAKCPICSKIFKTEKLLKCHTKNCHTPGLAAATSACSVCRAVVPQRKLKFHQEIFHFLPPDFVSVCPLCGKGVRYMPWHLKKMHKETDLRRDLFHCKKCRQYFTSRDALEDHDRVHVVFTCAVCRRSFEAFLELCRHLLADHRKVFNLGERDGCRVDRRPPNSVQDLSSRPLYDVPDKTEVKFVDVDNDADVAESGGESLIVLELDEEEDNDEPGLQLSNGPQKNYSDPSDNLYRVLGGNEDGMVFIMSEDAIDLGVTGPTDEQSRSVESGDSNINVEETGCASVVAEVAPPTVADEMNVAVFADPLHPHLVCFIDDENRLGKEWSQLMATSK